MVLLLEHDNEEGTFGIIINRSARITLRDVFEELKIDLSPEWTDESLPPVMEGGPVTPELGWVIHSPDWHCEQTRVFGGTTAVTSSREILEVIAHREGPAVWWFCLGYAGWAAGQLVGEIREGAWLHLSYEDELIFRVPPAERWHTAISRLGIDPLCLSPVVGGA